MRRVADQRKKWQMYRHIYDLRFINPNRDKQMSENIQWTIHRVSPLVIKNVCQQYPGLLRRKTQYPRMKAPSRGW